MLKDDARMHLGEQEERITEVAIKHRGRSIHDASAKGIEALGVGVGLGESIVVVTKGNGHLILSRGMAIVGGNTRVDRVNPRDSASNGGKGDRQHHATNNAGGAAAAGGGIALTSGHDFPFQEVDHGRSGISTKRERGEAKGRDNRESCCCSCVEHGDEIDLDRD